MMSYRKMIRGFSKRIYKLSFNKDLNRQEKYIKEEYDNLVEDIVSEVPIKCPVYQCGGYMKTVIRKPPKDFTYEDEYDGNEQTPDMVCTDCGARYNFNGFRKKKYDIKKMHTNCKIIFGSGRESIKRYDIVILKESKVRGKKK